MALMTGGTAAARRRRLAIFAARSESWAGDHLLSNAVRVRLHMSNDSTHRFDISD